MISKNDYVVLSSTDSSHRPYRVISKFQEKITVEPFSLTRQEFGVGCKLSELRITVNISEVKVHGCECVYAS